MKTTNSKDDVRTQQPAAEPVGDPDGGKQGVRINGFQQVVDMLHAADPAFRESLLKRIAGHDRKLAATLRQTLNDR